jgi:two-component system, cell cycle response regulator DivK
MKIVLLVEDDPVNALVFTKILSKRAGLTVKHTEDVEEVLQLSEAGTVGVILMDISLANSMYQGQSVDGIKITQMLKADPKTAHLPILLVTAHVMEGDREFFLHQSGADGYISKPITDQEAFVTQIKTIIARNSSDELPVK